MLDKKQIVEQINAAFMEGKTEGFLDHCAENVVWTMVGEKITTGKSEIREWMSQMEGCEPPVFSVDKMVEEDNTVICYGDMTMKGENDTEDKYSYCDAYEFEGDKVTGLRSFVVKHKTEELTDAAAG